MSSDSEGDDDVTTAVSGAYGTSLDDWMDEEPSDHLCLFCEKVFQSATETFVHCRDAHQFDIATMKEKHRLDCYTFIKLINYIRCQHYDAPSLLASIGSGQRPWDDDQYFTPSLPNDLLLCFDIEELEPELKREESMPVAMSHDLDQSAANITLPLAAYNELLLKLQAYEAQAIHAQDDLATVLSDMNTLRSAAQAVMSSSQGDTAACLPSGDGAISCLRIEDDQVYIDSYSHFSIHEEMLKDLVRTNSYRDCIYFNESVFRDQVVLDVGCGLGILSLFAAKAGARLVIGVDQSESIFQAMDIVRENGFADRITLIHGKMEDVELPVEKVDIIISEWMGYFLLYESMLDTVLWARNQYLKSDGRVLPDHCSLCIVGLHDDAMYADRISFWDDVNGFKMSCMKPVVLSEPEVRVVDKDKVITEPAVVKTLDTLTSLYRDLEFESDFSLSVTRSGLITSLVGYFDIEFCCPTKVQFSTSPRSEPTHWKQTVFFLETPLAVCEGDVIVGRMTCKKHRKDPRGLRIVITMAGRTNTYDMK